MSWATVMASRLRGLFVREQRLDTELQFHLEMQIEDNLKAGMNADEARYAAMRSFGAMEPMKETYREQRTFSLVETTVKDLRYAARTLRKNPAFTWTAVSVLALAIGANTAMFSVLNAVLLRSLPYNSPEQLALLWSEDPTQNLREGRSALWDVEQWQKQNQSFSGLATFDSVLTILTTSDGAEQLLGASISPNLLPLLGVQPILGRSFSAEEAEQEQHLVLISHNFWQARFGGSPTALDSTLMLDGSPSRIIGILPAGFGIARLNADVWKPHTRVRPARGSETWSVVGRLRSGVSFERAQTEMTAIARRINEQRPAIEANRGINVVSLNHYMVGPQSRLALSILACAVFCVFLIAAANVTSLSLARSVTRGREMTIRASLGASPARILRQLLTENILLAAVSGAIGAVLALAAIRLIRIFGPANLPRLNEATLDTRVLAWALAISLIAGILVGLSPAVATLRRNLRPSGEEGGRSVSGGSGIRRMRRLLVVADFALAILLLTGAGLLVRSWWNVTRIDPGFRPKRVMSMQVATPPSFDMPTQRNDLYARILEELQALPGVESAGIADDFFSDNPREHVLTTDSPERMRLTRDEVSADFFKALGTPLLRGRFFSNKEDRPGAPLVAIINEAMAKRSWPGQDPIGRRFTIGLREPGSAWYTVVGVVADMRRQGLEREPLPQIFMSLDQNPASRNVNIFVRTSSDDPAAMAGAIREAVRRAEKNAPITGMAPLEQQFRIYLAQRRFQTSLLTGFSIVALLMAAVGIYGLIHYSIATRTQEIGLRMAIGAQTGEIFRMVLGEGLKLSLIGLAIGLIGALWLGQTASSLLLGVTSTDPMTFTAVALLVITVAITACFFPARRAMKIEPIVALRQD